MFPNHSAFDICLVNINLNMKVMEKQKCKSCGELLKSILKHIHKKPDCFKQYNEGEINKLKKASSLNSKSQAQEWQKKNKAHVAEKKAERYQRNKAELAKKYQLEKESKRIKMSNYYQKNSEDILFKKANYYQANRPKIAVRRQAAKMKTGTSNINKNSSIGNASNYNFQRKEIDFTMADLENDAEESDDDNYEPTSEEDYYEHDD